MATAVRVWAPGVVAEELGATAETAATQVRAPLGSHVIKAAAVAAEQGFQEGMEAILEVPGPVGFTVEGPVGTRSRMATALHARAAEEGAVVTP